MRNKKPTSPLGLVGFREWVHLPDLGLQNIKAKIDTGARTSALHAFSIQDFFENGKHRIRFLIHPIQHNTDTVMQCESDIIDKRIVTDSGGHSEERFVIRSQLILGLFQFEIELTLTERDNMRFRMLLGRNALKRRFIVNPAGSFLLSSDRCI